MIDFFKRTYQHQQLYNMSMQSLFSTISTFPSSHDLQDHYLDEQRYEGFFKSSKYYISFELHHVTNGVLLCTTTTCKLPFYIPKTYTNGFNLYIHEKTR